MGAAGFNNVSHGAAMMPANPPVATIVTDLPAGIRRTRQDTDYMDLDFLRLARDRFLQTSTLFLGLGCSAPGTTNSAAAPACPPACPATWPATAIPAEPHRVLPIAA